MRSLGTIYMPYIRKIDDRKFKIEGYTKNDNDVCLTIILNYDRTHRLDTLACAISTLKELFLSNKDSAEEHIKNAYTRARRW